jgi:hypothetical protein
VEVEEFGMLQMRQLLQVNGITLLCFDQSASDGFISKDI